MTNGYGRESYDCAGMLQADEKLIAEVGGRRVMYSELWCDRALAAANPRWLKGKSVEAACAEVERDRFGVIAARILIEKVCELERLEPSDAEVDLQRPPALKSESVMRELVALGRKRPEAVLRVYRGEALEAVYDEVIKPMGMPGSLEDFRKEVAMYRSAEVVERYLAKDWVAKARHNYEQMARGEARRVAVRKRIESIAAAKNQSLRDAADDYFKWMADRVGVRIHDARFELPAGREVFR